MGDIISWAFQVDKDFYDSLFIAKDLNQEVKNIGRITGYERADCFFYDNTIHVMHDIDVENDSSTQFYDAANYYSSRVVAENNARADKLMRQLRRFAVEHRGLDEQQKGHVYGLSFDMNGCVCVEQQVLGYSFGQIYFDSVVAAELAINKFKNELTWYFSEYVKNLCGGCI